MKPGYLIAVVVMLVLVSQAGIGVLAFQLESRQRAFAEVQQLEQTRLKALRLEVAEAEYTLKSLHPSKALLAAEAAGLKIQIQEAKVELESTLDEVRGLKLDEERLRRITLESEESTGKLASIKAEAAIAQEGLEAKKKLAAVLDAKVTRLLDDLERVTKDAAFVETAESVGKAMNERLFKLQQSLAEQEEIAKRSATKAAEATVALEEANQNLADLEKRKESFEQRILERRLELATLDGELSQRRRDLRASSESEDGKEGVDE
jgi:hypothetical protein